MKPKSEFEHVVFVSTVPYFLVSQLGGVIRKILQEGKKVSVITSSGREISELPEHKNLYIHTIEIARKVSPVQDFWTLIQLYRFFRVSEIDILHSTTPKAGLLCAIAGKIAGIPIRLHTFTGQPWVTRSGIWRRVLQWSDRMVIALSTHCYADSPSQRDFLIQERLCSMNDLSVVGCGSLGGVDLERFSRHRWNGEVQREIRCRLGIQVNDFVILYLGRVTRDKGIWELLAAFGKLHQNHPNSYMLLVGPVDAGENELLEKASSQQNVCCLGYQSDPERYIAISDVLCLPSYREGFGTVVIEAAAMGVPAIGTRIPGLVDAVEDGVTGVLVPAKNTDALLKALEEMATDPSGRAMMGRQAENRVWKLFSTDKVAQALIDVYRYWWKLVKQ